MRTAVAALMLAGLLAAVRRPEAAMPGAPLTVRSLEGLGAFTVTLEGEALQSFPSGVPCVYFEWAVGEKSGSEWAVRYATHHSGKPLTVVTPRGRLELAYNAIRLYLPVSRSRVYTKQQAAAAPEVVQDLLSEHPAVTLDEIVLEGGRTYHAQVDVESYSLPPEPGSDRPQKRRHFVLAISDLPFRNGRPQRQITPAFVGIRY